MVVIWPSKITREMPLTDLDERERDVVRQCLKAAVESPFFPEWEFGTIFGLERDDVRRVLMSLWGG